VTAALLVAQLWTIVAVPDTQHAAQYQALTTTHIRRMVDEINRRAPLATVQVGDYVQNGGPANNPEWGWMCTETDLIQTPFMVAPGNHDRDQSATTFVAFEQRVGAANSYRRIGDVAFLALEYYCPDWALSWAIPLLEANPVPTVIVTHQWIGRGDVTASMTDFGSTLGKADWNGTLAVWEKVVLPYPWVIGAVCGHAHGQGFRVDTNRIGYPVFAHLANAQDDPSGGSGLHSYLSFYERESFMLAETMSVERGIDWSKFEVQQRTLWFPAPVGVLRWFLARTTYHHIRSGADTVVRGYTPSGGWGSYPEVWIHQGGVHETGLLRFDLPARLDPSHIIYADVTITHESSSGGATGDGYDAYRMQKPWDESSNWGNLGGIVVGRDTEATPSWTAEGIHHGLYAPVTRHWDVTADVRAWASGTPNHGWVMFGRGTDDTKLRSFDWVSLSERPLLTVAVWR